MTEKILEKLYALDETERILEAKRAKQKTFRLEQTKMSLIIPLLSELQEEFGGTVAPSASKTMSEFTEDKSCDLKKSKMHMSFKCKPEPRHDSEKSDLNLPVFATNVNYKEKPKEENPRSSPISLHYLKDKNEAEYAKPLQLLDFQPRNWYKRPAESSVLSSEVTHQSNAVEEERVSTPFTDPNESRVKKFMTPDNSAGFIKKGTKYPLEVNEFITKENQSSRNDRVRTSHPVKNNILLPLYYEDMLKNPEVKTIDLGPTETVLYFREQSQANLVVYYDPEDAYMMLLTRRFAPYVMGNTRKNVALEKNCDMFEALYEDKSCAVSKPQRTEPVAQQRDLQAFSAERFYKGINQKRKKIHDSLASEKRHPSTLYNLSRTFSSLTKKFVCYFDKDATQEKSAKTGEFGRIFSKSKSIPKRKFTSLPIKYDSKPLKNVLEIRKLNNVTPLDNLLSWEVNYS